MNTLAQEITLMLAIGVGLLVGVMIALIWPLLGDLDGINPFYDEEDFK